MDLFGFVVDDAFFFQIVTLVIGLAVLAAIIAISFFVLKRRKSPEHRHAERIAKRIMAIHEGRVSHPGAVKKLEIKKEETTLKSLLIKKFKPKIEEQLGSKVEVLDFNAKDEVFLVLVSISGVKVLLKLDPSGKIMDYERAKKRR